MAEEGASRRSAGVPDLGEDLLPQATVLDGGGGSFTSLALGQAVLSTHSFHKHKIMPHLYIVQVQSRRAAALTCGESLNMGAHTMSGVEWCLAASARV